MKRGFALLFVLLLAIPSVFAQPAGVEEVTGNLSDGFSVIGLPDMEAGQTLYVYVESQDFDTLLQICGEDACAEEELASSDDISSDNTNSALEFEFPTDGFYFIIVRDCCDAEAEGAFRLLVSLDTPEVLTGEAEPTGASIVFIAGVTDVADLEGAGESGSSTVYTHACLPEHNPDNGYPMDVREVAEVFVGDSGSVEDFFTEFFGTTDWEEVQARSDAGEFSWYFLIPFLQDVYQVQLHPCRTDNGEFSFFVP